MQDRQLKVEISTLRRALARMWFAYANKDDDCPHEFELDAVAEAEALLGPWEKCMSEWMETEEGNA